jgi:hypothetical protein
MTLLGAVVFFMIFAPLVALAFVARSRDCWRARYDSLRGITVPALRSLAMEGDEHARCVLRELHEPLPVEIN